VARITLILYCRPTAALSQVLCDGDDVTGLLDFEFTARDWRVMEAVVGLSKFCGLAEPGPSVAAYLDGYAAGGGRLTRRECELVPALIRARVLSNVVYFAGRAVSGEDSVEPLSGRAGVYAKRVRWLHDAEAWLVGQVQSRLLLQVEE
jgi:homoserine kinase type II